MNTTTHTVADHKRAPLADYFKEIIYGGIDGIITTFAVVAGFAGAALSTDTTVQLSFTIVLLFGLANLFADAASMGLGNFLSVRSEQDQYEEARKGEQTLIQTSPEIEYQETIAIMQTKGFTVEQATILADIYRTNEEYWIDFMMNHELELSDPRGENPFATGLATFLSFMVFGAIPLLPFIFEVGGTAGEVFLYSVIGTFLALVALGLLKWRVVGAHLGKSLTEVVLVGGVAAVIAYFVGTFFAV